MKAQVYRDKAGDWRWRVLADNGNVLADGGQGYSRRIDALHGLEEVTDTKVAGTWKALVNTSRLRPKVRMTLEIEP